MSRSPMCIGWHIKASDVPTVQQGGGGICEDINKYHKFNEIYDPVIHHGHVSH